MMKILIFTSVLLIFTVHSSVNFTDGVTCYACTDVSDESLCTSNTTTCGIGQSCFKTTRLMNNAEIMTLGCLNNDDCSSVSGASSIVGRDLYKRQGQVCKECCSTDLCNTQICHHQKPTACIDDESVDCARLDSIFNICNDVQHAKNVCPRFCKLCAVVDGEWSTWTGWSHCDVSCNNGTETRTRSCTNPQPAHGGLNCIGGRQEMRSCYKATVCPVNGGWATWTHWGSCSVSCETGIQQRQRTCTNPKPAYYGDHCFGPNVESKLCTEVACNDGGWSSWSSWGQCSKTCGVGMRSQSRICNNPRPSQNGQYCIGDPIHVDTCVIKQNCNETKYADCSEIKAHDIHVQDGIFEVTLWKSHRTIKVYCDMTTDGGGWTVFQKRYDGSVDFYRNFTQYENGFGDLNTEFWLGLDYIQEMTTQYTNDLRIDLMSANLTTAYETLTNFSISLPSYVLHLGSTISSNNIGSSYRFGPYHSGHAFSTYDHDVDPYSGNCASLRHGGWWYNSCYMANLNGQYLPPGTYGDDKGMIYHSFIFHTSLKQSRMAFRRT